MEVLTSAIINLVTTLGPLYSVIAPLLIVFLGNYFITCWKLRELTQLPTIGSIPFIGTAPFINRTPFGFYKQISSLCDRFREQKLYALRFGNKYSLQIFTADEVEKLCKSYDNIDKAERYSFLHKWLGMGLLTSTGAKWKERRHMLTPSFHFNIVRDALETMNNHVSAFRDQLLLELNDKQGKMSLDIFKYFTLLSLDIIGETAMGVQLDAVVNEHSEYVKAVLLAKDSIALRMRTPWWWPSIIFENIPTGRAVGRAIDIMHKQAYKVIKERREAMQGCTEVTHRNKAFLDTLLDCRDEDGNPLSDEDIREEVDTFMFEGHDTTSSALGFIVHLLGCHQDIQENCYQQLISVAGSPRHLSMEDLSKMTYLEWCIKESLRIYPPVPIFARKISADMEIGGHQIPRGCGDVAVVTAGLHRDPLYFPDPEKFDPMRFSPENSANRSPYAYVPFSAGPRNCIGQRFAMTELKVVMATLLLTFKIKSLQKDSELGLNPGLVLQPDNGIWVELTARE